MSAPSTHRLLRLGERLRTPARLLAGLAMLACVRTATIRQRTAAELLGEPGFAWRTDSTAHARVHYLASTAAADSLDRMLGAVERAWQRAHDFVGGAASPARVDVFLVPERPMVATLAHLPTQATGLNFWDTRVVIEWVDARRRPSAHELVHVLATDAHGDAQGWWLGEGAAVAAETWQGVDVHAFARCLADAGRLYPLSALVPAPDRELSPYVTYPEAGSFVRFLIERDGPDKFWRLYPRGASAVPEIYGQSLAALGDEWRRMLNTVDASGVRCAEVRRTP